MKTLNLRLEKHIDLLISRYPALGEVKQPIIDAYLVMEECYEHGRKLLIAGNGGSAADSEHIAGELMKRFKTPRPVTPEFAEKLISIDPVRGDNLAKNPERGLMAIPLVAHEALSTAYITMWTAWAFSPSSYMGLVVQAMYFLASVLVVIARMSCQLQ